MGFTLRTNATTHIFLPVPQGFAAEVVALICCHFVPYCDIAFNVLLDLSVIIFYNFQPDLKTHEVMHGNSLKTGSKGFNPADFD